MWNLLAVLALAVLAPPDVTVTKLDGTSVSGGLQTWSAREVVLTTADGPQSIPAADLVALEFSQQATGDSGKPQLELVDGSLLPLAAYTATDDRAFARLLLPSPAEPQPIVVPLDQVRAVRLQALDAAVLPQWQEIRQLGVPSDVIAMSKRGDSSCL